MNKATIVTDLQAAMEAANDADEFDPALRPEGLEPEHAHVLYAALRAALEILEPGMAAHWEHTGEWTVDR